MTRKSATKLERQQDTRRNRLHAFIAQLLRCFLGPDKVLSSSTSPSQTPRPQDMLITECLRRQPVYNQAHLPQCAAAAFVTALTCELYRCGLTTLPRTNKAPTVETVYQHALEQCGDRHAGRLTVRCIRRALLDLHGADLDDMRLQIYELPTSQVINVLQSGRTVIVGYLVDARREKFHGSTQIAQSFNYILPPLRSPAISGHCVVLVGLPKEISTSTPRRYYCLARNSFGAQWGLDGHFFIDLAHLSDESQTPDLWVFAEKTT